MARLMSLNLRVLLRVALVMGITGSGSAATALPVLTEFSITTPNAMPIGITAGPDGNLWFIEGLPNKIGRITPAGVVSEFAIPTPNAGALAITAGPDGNLWFTKDGLASTIGRITPTGVITEFPVPTFGAESIMAGPDGQLWFTKQFKMGRITTAGVIAEFAVPFDPLNLASNLAAGPDGSMWVTDRFGGGIVRLRPPFVTVSPASGDYVTTERFDLTLIVNSFGMAIAGGQVTLDGANVTLPLASCVIQGTILTGGVSLRCPDLQTKLPPGTHTFNVQLNFADGSSVTDAATWEFLANNEP